MTKKPLLTGLLLLTAGLILLFWYMIAMPGSSWQGATPPADAKEQRLAAEMQATVEHLSGAIGPRSTAAPDGLERAADWIRASWEAAGLKVQARSFPLPDGTAGTNLFVETGRADSREVVVVGAHYDGVGFIPAANDNASGVAALLVLARHFTRIPTARRIRFIAFTNEEPPWFGTPHMGSRISAGDSRQRGESIPAMISIETIGYYTDTPGTQSYPFPLGLFYPDRGNFIALIGNLSSRTLVRRALGVFRQVPLPSEGIAAPSWVPGVYWSDHWSYWREDYPAIMVTDTAPYRYPWYHKPGDTADRLDYHVMARVVQGLILVIGDLAGEE